MFLYYKTRNQFKTCFIFQKFFLACIKLSFISISFSFAIQRLIIIGFLAVKQGLLHVICLILGDSSDINLSKKEKQRTLFFISKFCRLDFFTNCKRRISNIFENIQEKKVYIANKKENTKKHVLVLDLDETLIHTTIHEPKRNGYKNDYHEIEILYRRKSKIYYVLKRPDLQLFLDKVSQYFELVLFTSSLYRYADPVIDLIDKNRVIKRRFFRNSCSKKSEGFVKNLNVVNSNLAKIAILDNSPEAYSLYPDNAIPITAWYDDPFDDELISLIPFLTALSIVKDVRSILRLRLRGGIEIRRDLFFDYRSAERDVLEKIDEIQTDSKKTL